MFMQSFTVSLQKDTFYNSGNYCMYKHITVITDFDVADIFTATVSSLAE